MQEWSTSCASRFGPRFDTVMTDVVCQREAGERRMPGGKGWSGTGVAF